MGGTIVHREPIDVTPLRNNPHCWDIFEWAGWKNYFQLLTKYSNERAEQFASTFDRQQAMVAGISFPVIEDLIGQVTGLPQNGENWEEKPNAQQIRQQFFQGEQYSQTKGGIETRSLPVGLERNCYIHHQILHMRRK
ncbi:hypothetical protein KI387_041679, partial [Taxus chinensis]